MPNTVSFALLFLAQSISLIDLSHILLLVQFYRWLQKYTRRIQSIFINIIEKVNVIKIVYKILSYIECMRFFVFKFIDFMSLSICIDHFTLHVFFRLYHRMMIYGNFWNFRICRVWQANRINFVSKLQWNDRNQAYVLRHKCPIFLYFIEIIYHSILTNNLIMQVKFHWIFFLRNHFQLKCGRFYWNSWLLWNGRQIFLPWHTRTISSLQFAYFLINKCTWSAAHNMPPKWMAISMADTLYSQHVCYMFPAH